MDIKRFKQPFTIYRPAPFWSWNDKLDKDEVKRQIEEMADKGWGGYFMHSRVGLVTEYLSKEWMELIRTCAEKAKDTNTYAWLYDEDRWPSGYAGGQVPEKNEAYRQRALVLLKADQLHSNHQILSEVKKNNENYYICKHISLMGSPRFKGASYVDLMNPETVKAFLKSTHEKYKEACGKYFGKEIPGIFTDEPCYLMEKLFSVPVLPWSDYLPDFFEKLKGYSIYDYLEQLFFDTGDYHKIRFDFFDAATKLFLESFTKQYYNWCEENDLKMTGHFMAEDSLTYQTQWIGAAMPHYEFMHWPGIDKLGRHIEQLVTVKQLTSVTEQLGKERALSEMFGGGGQQVSFFHRKWIADWQAVLGISFVNYHLSLYSMRGERKRDWPPNLFYQQPWWEEERGFSDYIARISQVAREGKRDVDILIIHPIASVWSEYSPLHKENDLAVEKGFYDKPFIRLSEELIANKLDFHYGDEIIMAEHAWVEDDKLVIGEHTYSTVIVPPSLTLRGTTLELLKEFAEKAGAENLIFISPFPSRVDGIESKIDIKKATKLANVDECVDLLNEVYSERIKIIDQMTGENAEKVICQQRNNGNEKLVLVANTDENREIRVQISVPDKRKPLIMDLMSGELYEVSSEYEDGWRRIKVKFEPAGSLLLLFSKESYQTRQMPAILESGVSFIGNYKVLDQINDWEVKPLEENVLSLNKVTLYLDGEKVLEKEPVAKAWQHFYGVPDGTPFEAEYTFDIDNIPTGKIFAVIEVAENLDRITLNGRKLTPLKEKGELGLYNPDKSWKDINFTKVPLSSAIQPGKNRLVLEGKKINNVTGPGFHRAVENPGEHYPTEVEAVYIVGDFKVQGNAEDGFFIDGDMDNSRELWAGNLTESGYPFYSGKVEFSARVKYKGNDCNNEIMLKLNDVNAACVQLYVNGQKAGTKYWGPYIFDIKELLKKGENEIKVIAATTLFNLMGPNWIVNIKNKKYVAPYPVKELDECGSFIDFANYTENYSFNKLGIGVARLINLRSKVR